MPAAHNHALRALVVPGLVALCRLAPGRHRVAVAARAAAQRVIDRVHHFAAHRRPDTAPAIGAGLADGTQVVLFIADFADGGAAVDMHPADFAGPQAQLRVRAFAREQLHARTRRTRDLRAFARLHFDAVDRR